MKPKLLDMFCCEGGAAVGYDRAGFEVFGVDRDPQPLYPFWFHQGDALAVLDRLRVGLGVEFVHPDGRRMVLFIEKIAAVHLSPPCQAHSTITPDASKHVDLIPDVRERMQRWSQPWVIENVEGARRALVDPVRLCGSAFGLRVRRHRYFESSVELQGTPCNHTAQGSPVGVYGGLRAKHWVRPNGASRGRKATSLAEGRDVMGMQWASWQGLTQAIPPAYTEFIGRQLMREVSPDDPSVPLTPTQLSSLARFGVTGADLKGEHDE